MHHRFPPSSPCTLSPTSGSGIGAAQTERKTALFAAWDGKGYHEQGIRGIQNTLLDLGQAGRHVKIDVAYATEGGEYAVSTLYRPRPS